MAKLLANDGMTVRPDPVVDDVDPIAPDPEPEPEPVDDGEGEDAEPEVVRGPGGRFVKAEPETD